MDRTYVIDYRLEERRLEARRRDFSRYRLMSRLFAVRRALGAETAVVMAQRMGLCIEDAEKILTIKSERRLRRRRF